MHSAEQKLEALTEEDLKKLRAIRTRVRKGDRRLRFDTEVETELKRIAATYTEAAISDAYKEIDGLK